MCRLLLGLICVNLLGFDTNLIAKEPYFHIQVVDAESGRGVPLVELETVNNIQLVTDSAGNIAFLEPGLMDREVFFHVRSHGYEYPQDGFGFRGVRLTTTPGGNATVKLPRLNIAERLYRVTGGGVYRDSLLLGLTPPIAEPALNAQVVGSDSVVNALYRGKLYWFWGDTNRPKYPLGNYQVPGATSRLPTDGGLDPAVGVNLEYFADPDGFAKSTAKIPGKGPTWIFGLTVLKNAAGQEELWTGYCKVEAPLTVYARGVARFNDQTSEFDNRQMFNEIPTLYPEGQTITLRDGDTDYVYFCTPYPLVRVKATPAAYSDPQQYEAYTCLKSGSRLDAPVIDRRADGSILYDWKRDTPAVGPAEQVKLIGSGQLKSDEALLRLRDRDTGKAVLAHTGTINWNAFRKRWVMTLVQHYGTSLLGEMWYSEADSPLGPWVYAVKVATHEKYSFYNPRQHPYFDQQGGRLIYFEGTYTNSFSGNNIQTPRYDYNQMIYRLDLADPRLSLPLPVRQGQSTARIFSPDSQFYFDHPKPDFSPPVAPAAFMALDHPGVNSIPVYCAASKADKDAFKLQVTAPPGNAAAKPVFHALPADLKDPPSTTALLYEWVLEAPGPLIYSINTKPPAPQYKRSEKPVCRVWKP